MLGWMRKKRADRARPDEFEKWLARTVMELRDDKAIVVKAKPSRGVYGIWAPPR